MNKFHSHRSMKTFRSASFREGVVCHCTACSNLARNFSGRKACLLILAFTFRALSMVCFLLIYVEFCFSVNYQLAWNCTSHAHLV
uniref:Uncharacterized protein n=1 Tax=Oryza brachyantha TaxID=4533 RepID=J3MSH2_ORYBR